MIGLAELFKKHNFWNQENPGNDLVQKIEEELVAEVLAEVIRESEEILSIDPDQPRQDILEQAAEKIVHDLKAQGATIRFFDPQSLKMLSLGSFGLDGYDREEAISAYDSVAGWVARKRRSKLVPNIMEEASYKSKKIVALHGINSLLAVPLRLPSFFSSSRDLLGSLQIYYAEKNRQFLRQEVIRAEMLARRVNFVLARKKILDLKALNDHKERLADQIFIRISHRQGVKLKDIFQLMVPELEEFIHIQSCSFFTLSEDLCRFHLESAYPPDKTYHVAGYTFTVEHHSYFQAAVHGGLHHEDYPYERVEEGYVLIKDPLKSSLTSEGLREFAELHHIHSILLVPLRVKGEVRHMLSFYATDQKQYFPEEEIELLTFFGKEIMKASRLEFLGEMLHDFKNPAIAVSGLAARAKRLFEENSTGEYAFESKLLTYLDVITRETARMQDLVQTVSGEGKEELLDLVETGRQRFILNEEVIRTSRLHGITSSGPGEDEPVLPVYCPRFGLERIIDNLLNNATKAIPREGGELVLHCYRDGAMACLELRNTGEIPAAELEVLQQSGGKGRGVHIISRFVSSHHGRLDIVVAHGSTSFIIKLPLHQHQSARP